MTAKVLQTASIVQVSSGIIRVAHPDISRNIKTNLLSPILAAGTAMTVADNHGLADNDYLIVGEIADPETEEVDINGAVTRGQSLTVTNSLKFSHEFDAPVTQIFEREVKIYGAATDGGSLTLIATVSIQWNREYTEYALKTADTTYAYYVAKFSDGASLLGSASGYVASTGLSRYTVQNVIDKALRKARQIAKGISIEDMIALVDEAQEAVLAFSYQDPQTLKITRVNWDFEQTSSVAITAVANQNEYDLSDLVSEMKFKETDRSVQSIRLGGFQPMNKIDSIRDFELLQFDSAKTTLTATANIGDTTLTVANNAEFDDSGTVYIGGEAITYTAKSGTTTLTGVPASGTGSITVQHASGDVVWQGLQPCLPSRYIIIGNVLYFDAPVKSDYEDLPIRIWYLKRLTSLTKLSDTIVIPFIEALADHLISALYERREKFAEADRYMSLFKERVLSEAQERQPFLEDYQRYHNYSNDLNEDDYDYDISNI